MLQLAVLSGLLQLFLWLCTYVVLYISHGVFTVRMYIFHTCVTVCVYAVNLVVQIHSHSTHSRAYH